MARRVSEGKNDDAGGNTRHGPSAERVPELPVWTAPSSWSLGPPATVRMDKLAADTFCAAAVSVDPDTETADAWYCLGTDITVCTCLTKIARLG